PEEVCSDTPDLLPAVRKRLEQIQYVGDQLDALFPEAPAKRGDALTVRTEIELPIISGYRVESVLGRGGMGVVFKAWHLRLHRPVALKMLLAGACGAPPERERFFREAEAAAGLQHPHIVQVHDVGEHDSRPYFTMEFLAGGTLAEKLAGTPQPAG